MAELLSSVPRELLLRVYSKYKIDYEMFGYSINTALAIGGHDLLKDNEEGEEIENK